MDTTGALSRPLIVAAVVVDSAGMVTMLLWHPDRFLLRQLEGLIPIALSLTGLGFLAAAFIRGKVRTVGFLVRPGIGFVAPTERRVGYALILFIGLAATTVGQGALYPHTPGTTDAERFMDLLVTSVSAVSSGLVAVVVCFCVGIVLAGRPRLDLTADGVRMRGVGVWRRAARWDEIVPSRQAEHDSVTLQLNRPGPSVKLLLLPIRVHGLFLSDAIRYYVEHPDRRAGIGTQVEYDHLMHALGVHASRP